MMDWVAQFNPQGLLVALFGPESPISEFHFIRPWLLALALLAIPLGILIRRQSKSVDWMQYLPAPMLQALTVGTSKSTGRWLWLAPWAWAIACLALAGPTWERKPVPTFRAEQPMVVALDLSLSMLSEDLAPNRITRAQLKIIDILRAREDGQTALLVYAGDAQRVAPLTDDIKTIEALVPALHPNIMPSTGSAAESAVELALQLMRDAGHQSGQILLITDGVTPDAQKTIQTQLTAGFRLSILGLGSVDAVPVPDGKGGFIANAGGELALTRLNRDELETLARTSGGRYVELQTNDSDINYLLSQETVETSENQEEATYDQWHDAGYWLIWLLIPVAIMGFRQGRVLAFICCLGFIYDVEAQSDLESPPPQSAEPGFSWQDLWLTRDQQASKILPQDPAAAAQRFKRQDWAGVAHYRAGQFEAAADAFARQHGQTDKTANPDNLYNQANTTAFTGDLQGALDLYNQVLEQVPDMDDALHNKAVIERLLQQQEQQQQNSDSQNQDQQDQQQDSGQDQQSDQNQSGDSDQDNSNQDSSDSSQQGDNPQSQNEQSEDNNGQQQPQDSSETESDEQSGQQNQNQPDSSDQGEQQPSQQSQQDNNEPDQEEADGQSPQPQPSEQQNEQQAEAAQAEQSEGDEGTPLSPTSEQLLRAVPEDPGGFLRRKFEHIARQRERDGSSRPTAPPNQNEPRY